MRKFMTAAALCLFASGIACAATTPLPATGQNICYDANGGVVACAGTGQDGDKLKGVAWPTARFTDNLNGTVTDNLTGLVWLKNANCFGQKNWADALASSRNLASGACGLSDGSSAGEWRLPNRKELQSLIDRSKDNPALPGGHPFTGVQTQSGFYWTSSTDASSSANAWSVGMNYGGVGVGPKTGTYFVWPVISGK